MNEPKTKLMVGVLGLLAVISFVSAEAITKLSNSVNQNQVAQVSRTSTATSSTTPTITRTSDTVATTSPTYKRGDSSPIIKEVQQDLADQGIYKGLISGQLGPRTEAAIKEFQTKNGLSPTGTLDTLTIGKIIKTGGKEGEKLCSPNSAPWIKVISPNGGETYQSGQQILVTWDTCHAATDDQVMIILKSNQTPFGAEITTVPDTGSATVTLPTMLGGGQAFVIPGTYYKIHLELGGNAMGGVTPLVDDSDNLFTIGGSGDSELSMLQSDCNSGNPFWLHILTPQSGDQIPYTTSLLGPHSEINVRVAVCDLLDPDFDRTNSLYVLTGGQSGQGLWFDTSLNPDDSSWNGDVIWEPEASYAPLLIYNFKTLTNTAGVGAHILKVRRSIPGYAVNGISTIDFSGQFHVTQ